ncbi:MAG: hypothetical protein M3P84_10550 [Chloroflexota bacterium]|nr:hypothetical protein [Chloroflexota bacterium]
MPPPALLAIALILFVLLLAPTSRLQRAGWHPRALGGYLIAMFLLSLLVAWLPGTRFLIPIIVLGFLIPFISVRAGRWRRPARSAVVERPPIKTVHGPARDVSPTEASDDLPGADRSGADEGGSGTTR